MILQCWWEEALLKINACIFILSLIWAVNFSYADEYMKAENSIDTMCINKDRTAVPFPLFNFRLFKKKDSQVILSHLEPGEFTDEYSYQITLTTFQKFGDTLESETDFIPGCFRSLLMLERDDVGNLMIYFECEDNGGFGELKWTQTELLMNGYFVFPNGHPTLELGTDNSIQLECLFPGQKFKEFHQ